MRLVTQWVPLLKLWKEKPPMSVEVPETPLSRLWKR